MLLASAPAPSPVPTLTFAVPAGYHLAAIDYHTPDQPADDGVAGQLLFLVRDDVVSFGAAWDAVVADYRAALIAEGTPLSHGLNYGDVAEAPDALFAAHGLALVTFPITDRLQVDHDEILIDAREVNAAVGAAVGSPVGRAASESGGDDTEPEVG